MRAFCSTLRGRALAGSLVALAACSPETSFVQSEAGAELASSGFGDATRTNTLVQSDARTAGIALAARFDTEVPSRVTFDFNSAVLDANAQTILREQARWIRQFPEVRFRIYGHTDLVGPAAYNERLGLRRAQAVVAYMTAQGIDRRRLEAVASFGETRPIVRTSDPERRNRRTVTEVNGFFEPAAAGLDGRYAAIVYRDYVSSAGQKTTVERAVAE